MLNVINATDPFFSRSNTWLGNPRTAVLLVPNAPHTLLNLSAARSATAGLLLFLRRPSPNLAIKIRY